MSSSVKTEREDLLTREEFANQVGLSVAEIRRRESLGRLKPAGRGKQKCALYTREQVRTLAGKGLARKPTEALRKPSETLFSFYSRISYTAPDGKSVFEMLKKGHSFEDIVMLLGIHPRAVQAIAFDYALMNGGINVSGQVMDRINRMSLDANFPITSGEEIEEVLKGYAEETCSRCHKRPKNICKHCAAAVIDELDI